MVAVVIFLFLLHARSALVPAITLPLTVLLSFVPMLYQGLTINIMSLGAIAVVTKHELVLAVVGGLFASLEWDTPSGPSIVVTALAIFVAGLIPVRGLIKRQEGRT